MFSQTVEYALRAMVCLAEYGDATCASSEVIASKTQVPQGYLSKVMRDLVVARLVVSRRGPNGGFVLARAPDDISMLNVVNAVEPLLRIERCPLGDPSHVTLCPLHDRIDRALCAVEVEFRRTTLAEILRAGLGGAAGDGNRPAPLGPEGCA